MARVLLLIALVLLAVTGGMVYYGYQMQHDDSFFDGTVEYEDGDVSELLATGTGLSFDINDNGTVDVAVGETSDAGEGFLNRDDTDGRELVHVDREVTMETGDTIAVDVFGINRTMTFHGVERQEPDDGLLESVLDRIGLGDEHQTVAVFDVEWDDNPMDVATFPVTDNWHVDLMFLWWVGTGFVAKWSLTSYLLYRRSRGGG